MNETEIKNFIAIMHELVKKEYEDQAAKLAATPMDHQDWNIENYMMGYQKGRYRLIEHLKSAI